MTCYILDSQGHYRTLEGQRLLTTLQTSQVLHRNRSHTRKFLSRRGVMPFAEVPIRTGTLHLYLESAVLEASQIQLRPGNPQLERVPSSLSRTGPLKAVSKKTYLASAFEEWTRKHGCVPCELKSGIGEWSELLMAKRQEFRL